MGHSANKTSATQSYILAAMLIIAGVAVAATAGWQLEARLAQTAQAQPQPPTNEPAKPAESKPGGTRPTTPPPEPARPDADAQKKGVKPALPPAPAEKMGEPVKK